MGFCNYCSAAISEENPEADVPAMVDPNEYAKHGLSDTSGCKTCVDRRVKLLVNAWFDASPEHDPGRYFEDAASTLCDRTGHVAISTHDAEIAAANARKLVNLERQLQIARDKIIEQDAILATYASQSAGMPA